jgi:16S rRNA (cytosine1402-N4)-methyltransferase
MAVNDELAAIEAGLDQALDLLAVDGRCVTIAYHSLEDRLVKQNFAAASAGCVCPPELPICGCGASPRFRLLTRGAAKPSPAEVASNPRARSARLRAVARVAA